MDSYKEEISSFHVIQWQQVSFNFNTFYVQFCAIIKKYKSKLCSVNIKINTWIPSIA